jgi:hypothetical protein
MANQFFDSMCNDYVCRDCWKIVDHCECEDKTPITLEVVRRYPRPGENRLLKWAVRGFIGATWLDLPTETQAQANAERARLVARNS